MQPQAAKALGAERLIKGSVQEVNELLAAGTDPWGAVSWWLHSTTTVGEVSSVRLLREDRHAAFRRAAVGETATDTE